MKKRVLFLFLTLATSSVCLSQEWLTSLDAAKRIALVQDKLLFMIWEDAALMPYPVIVNDEQGQGVLFENLLENKEINRILWDYFVPVIVSEDLYAELYHEIKNTRTRSYKSQFEDDNIKVMDPNFNIVNTSMSPEIYFNLTDFISRYALNTSFLKAEFASYSQHKNFNTAYRLASKYMDYAILVNEKVREDIVNLAEIYLDEADTYFLETDLDDKMHYEQKSNLLRISKYLILNQPRKVLRLLKKIDSSELHDTNASLQSFLYYTAFKLREDEPNAALWKSKLSPINLRKAELIMANYL